jgi:hypothetical protein
VLYVGQNAIGLELDMEGVGMKQICVWAGWVALGFAFGTGCGKAVDNESGGDAYWLQNCSLDSECGPELACHCGVCTIDCTNGSQCSELGNDASCTIQAIAPFAQACGPEAPRYLCAHAVPMEEATEPRPVLSAAPYDEMSDCFEPALPIGLAPAPDGLCAGPPMHAVDALGNCWLFSSNCIPDEFVALDALSSDIGQACREASETCVPTGTCVGKDVLLGGNPGGPELQPGECLTCDEARARRSEALSQLITVNGWAACDADADCVAQPIENTRRACEAECAHAVAIAHVEDFLSLSASVTDYYCASNWEARCGVLEPQDCNTEAVCRAGQCQN